jgi:hypothetical protein
MSPARAPEQCTLYVPGHMVHVIQVFHSRSEPRTPRSGSIVSVGSGVVIVDLGGEQRRYRNHETQRIRDVVRDHRPEVNVDEGWSILRLPHPGGTYCFSIASADEPLLPCRTDEQTRFDVEGIRERLISHGGFLIPGKVVLDALTDPEPEAGTAEQTSGAGDE